MNLKRSVCSSGKSALKRLTRTRDGHLLARRSSTYGAIGSPAPTNATTEMVFSSSNSPMRCVTKRPRAARCTRVATTKRSTIGLTDHSADNILL